MVACCFHLLWIPGVEILKITLHLVQGEDQMMVAGALVMGIFSGHHSPVNHCVGGAQGVSVRQQPWTCTRIVGESTLISQDGCPLSWVYASSSVCTCIHTAVAWRRANRSQIRRQGP